MASKFKPKNPIFYWKLFRGFVGSKLPWLVFLAFFSGLFEALGISLFLPLLKFGKVAPSGPGPSRLERICQVLGFTPNLYSVLVTILVVFTLRGVFKALETYIRARSSSLIRAMLRKETIQALKKMDYQQYLTWSRWNVTHMMTSQIHTASNCFSAYCRFLSGCVSVLAFVVASLVAKWELALIGLSLSAGVVYNLRKTSQRSYRLARKETKLFRRINSQVIQILSAYKYLKGTNGFHHFESHLNKIIQKSNMAEKKIGLYRGVFLGATYPLTALILVAVIEYSLNFRKISLSLVLLTVGLLYKALASVMQTLGHWHVFSESAFQLHSLVEGLSHMKQMEEKQGKRAANKIRKAISFRNVSLTLTGTEILNGVTFDIPVNSTVGICGASGVGKSTLVDLILGLIKPTAGKVLLDGIPLNEFNLNTWRKRVGFISQDYPLFEDTLFNNITLWDKQKSKTSSSDSFQRALEESSSLSFINKLSRSVETRIGNKGKGFSAGEKQRLALARELFRDPPFLILDEATSALDSETENRIEQSLRKWHGKKTLVIVSHQLNFLAHCDRILVLREGTVVEQGTFGELTENPASTFSKMYAIQNRKNVGNL